MLYQYVRTTSTEGAHDGVGGETPAAMTNGES